MDESPTALPNDTFLQNSWVEDADWWLGAIEEDTLSSAASLLPQFGGDLLSTFLPPPPRPSFLDVPGGPPCDLCGWAWQEGEGTKGPSNADGVEGDLLLVLDGTDGAKTNGTTVDDIPHEFGWVLALVVVSIVSAVLGAIIMVTAIQCRNRLKNIRSRGVCTLCRTVGGSPTEGHGTCAGAELHGDDADKGHSRASAVDSLALPTISHTPVQSSIGHGVWRWLTTRTSGRYTNEPSPHVERRHHYTPENHYTMSSTGRAVAPMTTAGVGSIVEEALYAELNHGDTAEGSQSPEYEDPSYQNMAYQGSEMDPPSSGCLSASSSPAPPLSSSSAYYSDLSTSAQAPDAGWEATYEAVDTEPPRVPPAPSESRPEVIMTSREADSSAIGCRENRGGDRHMARNSRHHICPLPVTKTVPSDYV